MSDQPAQRRPAALTHGRSQTRVRRLCNVRVKPEECAAQHTEMAGRLQCRPAASGTDQLRIAELLSSADRGDLIGLDARCLRKFSGHAQILRALQY